MQIAIIGAGNGGLAIAGHLAMKGNSIRIYDKFPAVLEPLRKAGAIRMKGVLGEGTHQVDMVSDSLEDTIRAAPLILIVTPASAHEEIARAVAAHLEEGQVVVLHPGRTGGAMSFRRALRDAGCGVRVYIAEAQTLLYACRKTGPSEVHVMGLKKKVKVAALPASDTPHVLGLLSPLLPQFEPARDVLETSLMNIGSVFHPAPTLLNMGRIEDSLGDFMYYHQGITPSVARIVEQIDQERLSVSRRLGVEAVSAADWLREAYGVSAPTLYECIQANKAYAGVKGPSSVNVRYVTEDVPTGLVPISSLGQIVGVETPLMNTFIDLASALHATDYRSIGRNVAALGIKGFGKEELLHFVRKSTA